MNIKDLEGKIDKSQFTTEGFVKRVEKPWGYELILTPTELPYTGKVIHVQAGKRLSLQIHDEKRETYLLISGRGGVIIEDKSGEMLTVELEPNQGYSVAVGQKHRIYAITDCDIAEFSTPEIGTTYRLEDDFNRPDETEDLRKEPNRGWNQ